MPEHHFKVRRGDLEFEVRGDRDFVEAAVERWCGQVFNYPAVRDRDSERVAMPPASIKVRKNISFEDFLKLKGPQTSIDRLLTLAYFLEKYEGKAKYDLGELDRAWYQSFPDDAFTPDIWKDAMARGYLEESNGRLTLTFSGEAYVQAGLADQYRRYP
jgi:hypothetical protein